MRFFTDGGAKYPKHAYARLATWAVVQDIALNETQMRSAADFLFMDPPRFAKFSVLSVGLVPGDQTVARAELFAILHAVKQVHMCEPVPTVEFVTDASYVCRIVFIILHFEFRHNLHKFANGDLILELSKLWCPDKFTIRKVKSHRLLHSGKDLWDLWYIAGNMCADIAATSA